MSKEKQIEEMGKIITKAYYNKHCWKIACQNCKYYELDADVCQNCLFAESLYNAGYRKQSENVIELPCKIGDTVYIIDEADDECGEDYVLAVKVLQFFINEHGIAVDLALPLGLRQNTWMVVGKNVFLTREEAEAHMRKEDEGK